LFLNFSKNLISKINEESNFIIEFDNNLSSLFKKIIIKSIKKVLIYRSKETYGSFDFIININNYQKYLSNSKKNLVIYITLIYIFHLLSYHDSKTESNQIILTNYINDLINLNCKSKEKKDEYEENINQEIRYQQPNDISSNLINDECGN